MQKLNSSPSKFQYYIIIGGGPVGFYLAYQLLKQANVRVFLFEGRALDRPQVIRIPFCVADALPQMVKNKLWRDEETRQSIFSNHRTDHSNFWPVPGYVYWPWITIGLLQESLKQYLQTRPECAERFFLIQTEVQLTKNNILAEIAARFPEHFASVIHELTAIFCTCGAYASSLRQDLGVAAGKLPEQKGHGIYLIYQNAQRENYRRKNQFLSYSQLGERGISYAASNDDHYDVQLYTYPAGELSDVFQSIPDDFIHAARYRSQAHALDMSGEGLSEEAKRWFEKYKSIVYAEIAEADIPIPEDTKKINVYYAARSEYYWNTVATVWPFSDDSIIPLYFLGDSAGSTDYKFGISVGRGLLAVDMLLNSINENPTSLDTVSVEYQHYWNKVIAREFNKGPFLSAEPWIIYQYLIKGRQVVIRNQVIHFSNDEQYEIYLSEYQRLSPRFYQSTEASAVLYVNAKALAENIRNIAAFSERCHSKVIGVIKSDAYGIGTRLVANAAIASNVNFLAVAKLQEAVALRVQGVHRQIRLMVFETPMSYDLSTYADYDIEMVLPVSEGDASINMIKQWLQYYDPVNDTTLKIHLMVDTGLRRDGGHDVNLPQSVMSMILDLQRLHSNHIVFSGIATHLSCYRCTDYRGEEIENFRALQLRRLKQVATYLLANGIKIPSIHVGGGLALLSEKWPLQFAEIANDGNIQFYTRVGHGLYGMEHVTDLHQDSPALRQIACFELQVRNVFFVEEGEPVSYGGYWRAPTGGVWIATLSGGWADGVPRTAQTLGEWEKGVSVSINQSLYPVVGKINMNAMMVNLGGVTSVKPGDRAIVFGWGENDPTLHELAWQSGHIGPSIMSNIPPSIPRIVVSE